MQIGASIPVADIGTGPAVLRDYAQAAEELGYAHLVAPDHVLGASPADVNPARLERRQLPVGWWAPVGGNFLGGSGILLPAGN